MILTRVGRSHRKGLHSGRKTARLSYCARGSLANTLANNAAATPPPVWANEDRYRMSVESDIQDRISGIDEGLTGLQAKKCVLENELVSAAEPRRLLFEKGRLLEDAILDSLRSMGFGATRFQEGESEFDGIFTTPEGERYIGEAEGRDDKAIGIEKLDQLQRNLLEDYDRDEVNELARGILFGNGHRLLAPKERGDAFTDKCREAAKRYGCVLTATSDMFEPTQYMKEHPNDEKYAKECRAAIADASGEIVQFPAPPHNQKAKQK